MNGQKFQLHPPVRTSFLIGATVIVVVLVGFSLISTGRIPAEFWGLLILLIPFSAWLKRSNHIAEIGDQNLSISSDHSGNGSWPLRDLDILEAREFNPLQEALPKQVPRSFWSNETGLQYGFVKLQDGQTVFHFISNPKDLLVLIPVKSGGHLLLNLKHPKEFLRALLATAPK
jgi:hypothetical protein